MDFKSKIILIYGPTASGKTEFAVKLAKKIKGEIINADSMQVYKDLKILSARPLKKDMHYIKHHIYGFMKAKNDYSTGDWIKTVIKKIKLIKKRNKIPILVGGTGLYFKSLTEGLVEIPNISKKDRNQIRFLQKKIGQKRFFDKLIKIDPLANIKIKSTDVQRSIRAYEVKLFTKKSIYDWYKETKSKFNNKDFIKLYIDFPRSELIERINSRVKKMFESGVISEIKKFLKLRVPSNKNVTNAIGISEIKNLIQNRLSKEQAIEKISIKTRQYAKRQVTWARGNMKNWKKIKPKNLDKFLKKI
jgi:tRNA dimethylallyltransferase